MKKLAFVFLAAFCLNLAWENAHSLLYIHYKGSPITEVVLVRAALFDAFVITLAAVAFQYSGFLHARQWLVIVPAILFAIGLELFALATGRWQYNAMMPLIPLLHVGLTPAIQLAVLAVASYRAARL